MRIQEVIHYINNNQTVEYSISNLYLQIFYKYVQIYNLIIKSTRKLKIINQTIKKKWVIFELSHLALQCSNINLIVRSTLSTMHLRSTAVVLWSSDTRSIDFSHTLNNSWHTSNCRFASSTVSPSRFAFIISSIFFRAFEWAQIWKDTIISYTRR